MAVMYPKVDPGTIPYESERLVYVALRDQLPNDYVAFHSYPWLRPDREGALREGEADFVVIHQQKGMLVLEAKGGEIRFEKGQWVRLEGATKKPITDPFFQARNSMHTLLDWIEKYSSREALRSQFTYGYAAVFPHDNSTGHAPPGSDPLIIITRREMPRFREAIEAAFAAWPARSQGLSSHQWNRLSSAMLPEFKLYQPVAAVSETLLEKIQEMTEEQIDVLRGLYDDNPRVYVKGVADSGKTQIALDRALSLAARGIRTLFVCYNISLAEHLNALVRNHPQHRSCLELLTIRHFHGLARELVIDAGMDWNPPEPEEERDRFYLETAPALVEQAVCLLLDEDRPVQFEAMVIDEAQDFHSGWWELLVMTLLTDADAGSIYAFGDPAQKLWDWAPDKPPMLFDVNYQLRKNCRNSRWIAKTSTRLANTDAELFRNSPRGGKPRIDVVPSAAAMKGAVMITVRNLLETEELIASQLVLIGPSKYDNGSLAGLKEIAGCPLTDSVERWHSGEGILVTTSRKFKGLESDVVVAYDLNHISPKFSWTDLYVACTRARSHIHFLATGQTMAGKIREVLTAVEHELGESQS